MASPYKRGEHLVQATIRVGTVLIWDQIGSVPINLVPLLCARCSLVYEEVQGPYRFGHFQYRRHFTALLAVAPSQPPLSTLGGPLVDDTITAYTLHEPVGIVGMPLSVPVQGDVGWSTTTMHLLGGGWCMAGGAPLWLNKLPPTTSQLRLPSN